MQTDSPSTTPERFTKRGFTRTYALPALFVLALPIAGLAFSAHAPSLLEGRARGTILQQIERLRGLTAEQKQDAKLAFPAIPLATVCQVERLPPPYQRACREFAYVEWIRRLSVASLGIGLFGFAFASACALCSYVSPPTLYGSFTAGWNGLKITVLLGALAQGALAVLLSYSMPAVWFNAAVLRLPFFIGTLVTIALWLMLEAQFRRVDDSLEVHGVLLHESRAPRLWARVRDLCAVLGTDPPARIVAGIDHNFFVTENPIQLEEEVLNGRTLFVSLSLLNVLGRGEADAILAHEMAHFSGDDTRQTRRMSPAMARYAANLDALAAGGWVVRPLFHQMLFFWAVFQVSINRNSRDREFRADSLAASVTSANALGCALLKVVAYSRYRLHVENDLFSRNARQDDIAIDSRLQLGFASYVASPQLASDLGEDAIEHPFDTHPGLNARLIAIRAPLKEQDYPAILRTPVEAPWADDIDGSAAIEQQLWAAYDAQFASAHEEAIAWRSAGVTEAERAVIDKHFPPLRFETKNRNATFEIRHEHVRYSRWRHDVPWQLVIKWSLRQSLWQRYLFIRVQGRWRRLRVPLHRFRDADELVESFQRYWIRHQVMKEEQSGRTLT